MDITYWHRFAYMYLENELEIAEIVKFWMIATYAGVITDEKKKLIGINVLDNSQLNEALILGLLRAYPVGQPVTYEALGEIISKHVNTVGKAVKSMLKKGYLTKEPVYKSGAIYTVEQDEHLPVWMIEFTEAVVQIATDEDVKKKVYEDCKGLGFKRGFQVLREEIVSKFYPGSRSKQQSEGETNE